MPKKQPVTKQTPSITEDQLAQLRDLMPQVFSEGKIDFEKLHASLGDFGNENPERYSFSWAGKRDAIKILQTPSRATLIPARKESVDFDKTQNIFIEGDNLEVLKLLYKPYFGQVKMIYIDPPYNTGNDFVYPDNFADPLDTYLKLTGQKDSEGNLLTSNAETSGRYHSAWLSMMYPRLFLARQLLQDDGVIFVSIDDHEVINLRMLMNEVFGEENFIACIVWHNSSRVSDRVAVEHEYILLYAKHQEKIDKSWVSTREEVDRLLAIVKQAKEDGKTITEAEALLAQEVRVLLDEDIARNERRYSWLTNYQNIGEDWKIYYPVDLSGEGNGPTRRFGNKLVPAPPGRHWMSQDYIDELYAENRIAWRGDRAYRKLYIEESVETLKGIIKIPTRRGSEFLKVLLGKDIFDKPKPHDLPKHLAKFITSENDLILDFFAGSATTAQAVLELNREDGGNRKFILVQLPEPTENKEFPTIAEIGKERIRRVIKKMKTLTPNPSPKGRGESGAKQLGMTLETRDKPEDLGFKVFKLRESNYKQWDESEQKDPKAYAKQMEMLADPLVKGWKEEDVLYEVALKEGYGLNVVVDDTDVKGIQKVSDPDKEQSFYLCLADKIKLKDIKSLNLKKDDLFICRDIALDDETAANLSLQCRLKTI